MSTNGLTTLASQPDAPGNLINRYEKRDHYAVINATQALLKHDASNPPAALLAARSYLELGLVGPARELLGAMGDDSALTAEAAELAQRIKTAKSGRLAWGRLQPRFDAPWLLSVLVIAALVGLSVLVLERRVRGVEVVT